MNQIQPSPQALDLARQVLRIEADAILALGERLNGAFLDAVGLILAGRGRVIVSGIGKSGHIGRKIASTLASTGTPAFFVHPAEASHGDLGMITPDDVVIAISNSGESMEILNILPSIKRQGAKLIAITGRPQSTLARDADVHLDAAVAQEACPLNLAPTASTTAALALGDALAVALLDARGFGAEDFARSHPGGALGRRLLIRMRDVMRQGADLPVVSPEATVAEATREISRGGIGIAIVIDTERRVVGVFTDGDLRRYLAGGATDVQTRPVVDLMTKNPSSVRAGRLAADALAIFQKHRFDDLVVLNADGTLAGMIDIQDLPKFKIL